MDIQNTCKYKFGYASQPHRHGKPSREQGAVPSPGRKKNRIINANKMDEPS